MNENERRIYEQCRNVSPFRDKQQTNEEWIRRCSTEELAEFILQNENIVFNLRRRIKGLKVVSCDDEPILEQIVLWLQEIHNDL